MRVEVIRSWEDAEPIKHAWLDLLGRCQSSNPFVHPGFCELWMKHHDAPNHLFVVGFHGSSGLTALAPLQILETGKRVKFRRARFIVARPWFEVDFLMTRPDTKIVCAALNSLRDEVDVPVAEFFALSGSSPSLALLESAVQGTRMSMEYSYSPRWRNAFVDIRGSWDSHLTTRSPKLRKNIRRASAQLKAQGAVATERYRGSDPEGRASAAIDHVSRRSWKGGRSLPSGGFWEDLIALMAREGWLDLHTLSLDGMPIAFALVLRYGETAYLLQTSYDLEYKAFSPGLLVILECAKALFSDGDPPRRLDFLSSASYLVRLSTGMGLRAKARIFMGGPESAVVKRMFRVKRRVKPVGGEVFFRTSSDLAAEMERIR